jgi:hypothetical protein
LKLRLIVLGAQSIERCAHVVVFDAWLVTQLLNEVAPPPKP